MQQDSSDRAADGGLTLRDAVALLARRRAIVLTCVVLVPLSAIGFSFTQNPVYQGEAEVLLSRQNLANSLTGTPDPNAQSNDGDRIAQTQAKLAAVPTVAGRTLRALGLTDRTPADLIENTEITTEQNSDILVFHVTDQNQAAAARLTNEYAHQYTRYRTEIDTAAVDRALEEVTQRLTALERRDDRSSALYSSLVDKQQQLRTLEALQTSNTFVVRREDDAEKIKPTPMRNGILGLVLGTILGIGLAFARDAFDTRLRSAEEVAESLGLPLLARIPISKRAQTEAGPVMLNDSFSATAETYRVLRGNLEFSTLGRELRTLMVSSSIEVEGKSTTIANLAIAWARSGKRVVLVDLDLRRPVVEKMFDLVGRPGVTNVALGQLTLEQACLPVSLPGAVTGTGGGAAANGGGDHGGEGSLDLLPCGAIPPDPGEFVGSEPLAKILATLKDRYDLVLIDAPPMLRVGDPLTLSGRVDGIFLVGRIGIVTSAMTKELRRILGTTSASVLGVVVTGAGDDSVYGYGYGYGYGETKAAAAAKPEESVS